jgi:GNAT superfamily N-acetyltransferase
MSSSDIEIQDSDLTSLGIRSVLDFYRTLALACLEKPGLCVALTGIASPFLNLVIDTRQVKELEKPDFQELATFFKKAAVPWGWMQTAEALEPELPKTFTFLEREPAFYCDLTQALPSTTLSSLEIREAKTSLELEKWIEPLREGFPSEDKGRAYLELNANLMEKGETKLRHYVGFYRESPVVGGTLFLSQHSVMLHNIATKNAFRKRGFAYALSLHLMEEAKKRGFKHCFLSSSEEGLSVYRKLGFKVYCENIFYLYEEQ